MPDNAVRHIRVLAIDDSSDFLSTLQSFFEAAEAFELIATARSGSEALRLVQKFHPDLVLMDLQMTGVNGLEATSAIRRRFPEIDVVIITAHDVPGLRQICYENGARDVVRKSRLNEELPHVLAGFLISRQT